MIFPRQAAILCGGLGTRLGALTAATPKPLLHVARRPFLEILIEEIARQGVRHVILLAGFEAGAIHDFARGLAQRLELDLSVEVAVEPYRAGTGGALFHARERLDEHFFLLNGDSWFDVLLADVAGALSDKTIGALALRRLADTDRYGVVEVEGPAITGFSPSRPGTGPGLTNAGVYAFRRALLERLSPDCSLENDILPRLAEEGRLSGVEASGYFLDIGIPSDFERAQTEVPAHRRKGAVFFDRDGVLNIDHGHVGSIDRFEWMPGAREALARVNRAGRYAFIVTNQAGIGKGKYTEEDYRAVRTHMARELASVGAHIDDERFCPDHPEAVIAAHRRLSDWRKPGPGMLRDLMRRWPIDPGRSFMIGDKASDMEAAKAAGIAGHLFTGGNLDVFIRSHL